MVPSAKSISVFAFMFLVFFSNLIFWKLAIWEGSLLFCSNSQHCSLCLQQIFLQKTWNSKTSRLAMESRMSHLIQVVVVFCWQFLKLMHWKCWGYIQTASNEDLVGVLSVKGFRNPTKMVFILQGLFLLLMLLSKDLFSGLQVSYFNVLCCCLVPNFCENLALQLHTSILQTSGDAEVCKLSTAGMFVVYFCGVFSVVGRNVCGSLPWYLFWCFTIASHTGEQHRASVFSHLSKYWIGQPLCE